MQPDEPQQVTPPTAPVVPSQPTESVAPTAPQPTAQPVATPAPITSEPPVPDPAAGVPPTAETPPPASITPTAPQPASPPPPDTVAQIAAQPHSATPDLREVYGTICTQIVKEQGQIIGALSYEQAGQIDGLQIDPATYNCIITGEPLVVLETLVDKYRQFFGNAAVEVCREAAMHLKARLPDEQIPELLRS